MAKTPDRTPGESDEEGTIYISQGSDPSVAGGVRYVGSDFRMKDGLGVFNPRYTDEMAQDAIGAMVDSSIIYVDGTPLLQRAALTGDVTASAGSNTLTIANDAVTFAKMLNSSGASVLIGRGSAGGAGDFQEITLGAGMAMTGTVLSSTGGYTDEAAQDAIGTILLDSATIDFTYDDATPTITAIIINSSVTYAKIQDVSATNRIMGRITAGAGVLEELTAAQASTIIGCVLKDGSIAMTGALQMGDQNITGAKTITFGSSPDSQTYSSGTLTVDFSAGQKHTVTLDASPGTIVFTAPAGIGNFMLIIKQGSPNTNTMAGWPATVKWPGGTVPVITTGASKVDVLSFYWDGTNYWGQYAQNFA